MRLRFHTINRLAPLSFPRDVEGISVIKVSSNDPQLFSKTQISNKLIIYPSLLIIHVGYAILDIGANSSLANTLFSQLGKLLL